MLEMDGTSNVLGNSYQTFVLQIEVKRCNSLRCCALDDLGHLIGWATEIKVQVNDCESSLGSRILLGALTWRW